MRFLIIICFASSLASISNANDVKLEKLNINQDTITLSGFSSGAGIAQQLLVSYPSLFKGIAVFQQTYYRCGSGHGNVTEFDIECTNLFPNASQHLPPYDPKLAVEDIKTYYQKGLIENPENLKNKKLYVYAGLQNFIFKPEMMLNILKVFEPFIDNPYAIRTRVQDVGYLFPTATFGAPCDQFAQPHFWIGNCKLNGPFEALYFLLGDEHVKLPGPNDKPILESLTTFDQSEFFAGVSGRHFMAEKGIMYIPKNCEKATNQKCNLHVYFHGCGTGADINNGSHIIHSGYLELAEVNNIIMLFPQIQKDDVNHLGCWDSFGNTGPLYATQQGVQVSIMKKIFERLIIGPPASSNTRSNNAGRRRATSNP